MSISKHPLTKQEIARGFRQGQLPFVTTRQQLAEIIGVSPKTITFWLAAGRLENTYRRRGNRVFFLTDRFLDVFFNGTEWHD